MYWELRLYQTEAVYKPLLSAAGASASDYVISSDADLRSWNGSEKPALGSDRVIISAQLQLLVLISTCDHARVNLSKSIII